MLIHMTELKCTTHVPFIEMIHLMAHGQTATYYCRHLPIHCMSSM